MGYKSVNDTKLKLNGWILNGFLLVWEPLFYHIYI